MTNKPKKPCRNRISCRAITNSKSGYCVECEPRFKEQSKIRKKEIRKKYDKKRNPIVKTWLNSARYLKARKSFLSREPFCNKCTTVRHPVLANILDHIVPHRGDSGLFWEYSNWQGLCKRCHDVKTAKYDSGFGNKKRDDYES